MPGNELSAQVAALRADHAALDRRVDGIADSLDAKHKENRASIHRLNNGQQDILDAMREGIEKISDKIGDRFKEVEHNVQDLRLGWAKAGGYALGLSASCAVIGGVVFELVKVWMEHRLK